jgi:4-carboxymuconolactone decarboxylase
MPRIDDVKVESLTPRQKKIYDDIMRTRPRSGGGLGGPFSVWIRTPDIAEHVDRLTNAFRVSAKLEKRLIELIILLVCRDATAKYAWGVHEPLGLRKD